VAAVYTVRDAALTWRLATERCVPRKTIDLTDIQALGEEKLARLLSARAQTDPVLRKMMESALAGVKGPKALSALLDRRLSALRRATRFVDWDEIKTFGEELQSLVDSIVNELGAADPDAAAERLLRFIATSESVFSRISDSRGRVDEVFSAALAGLSLVASRMADAEREILPDRAMAMLGDGGQEHLASVVNAVAGTLSPAALKKWDKAIGKLEAEFRAEETDRPNWALAGVIAEFVEARKALANALGDVDALIALETTKKPYRQDTIGIAKRLFAAGRLREALEWARRDIDSGNLVLTIDDMVDDAMFGDPFSNDRVLLEASILEAMGERDQARSLRWSSFAETLDPKMLREHIAHLDDFDEFDALDKAFAHVAAAKAHYRALAFFVEWPRLDLAAKLVVDKQNLWDGQHYDLLAPAAEALSHDHAAAATILYRALLIDILKAARSQAYGHGARYLATLEELAADADAAEAQGLDNHAAFRAGIEKAHGRKAAFWELVNAPTTRKGKR
jgi:hypothetical protein